MFNQKQLLIALHLVTVILQFNRLQYSIHEVLQHNNQYSYKLVNYYSQASIKLIFQSTGISLAFYMIVTGSYIIQLIVLFYLRNKNLNRYIYYHIFLLILLYTIGQQIQVYNSNFTDEVIKLTAYQNEENTHQALNDLHEDGQLAETVWKLYFTCTVLLIIVFKISYLYLGLEQLRQFLDIQL